ncbi:hypothetical protein [Pedobacter duraquae]|uniref:Uncharacterized protein n=1 Tax=Pedobacter duraquae TaxID=425511 RepID=A0A4R6IMG4_9SPHI|nr:hypothetical protein [Pedobacter duraquae]TDO23343.1 hypothetical protein CLV32_2334 [Pedobacter duraquae]
MKTTKKKFVAIFLTSGFIFLFLYNLGIRSVVRLIPESGAAFLRTDTLTGWKSAVATILYPVKIVLIGPVLPLMDLPDPPPPFLAIGLAIYWTVLALIIYNLVIKIKRFQTHNP